MKLLLLELVLLVSAAAQPASDLLQSGIYSQDTQGDLDAAIRIYRQILSAGDGMRLYAAQAQYRLGVCLLRKGDTAAAARAFESVIRDYPGETELVARAHENLPRGGLLPAPWPANEIAEYRWFIPGVEGGWSISRVAFSTKDPHTLRIQLNFYAPQPHVSMVDVDRESMHPLFTTYRLPASPKGQTAGGYGWMHIPVVGRDSLASRAGTVYVQGEVIYVLRRMSLFPGWSASISVATLDKSRVTLKAEVTGIETVVVPAGTFQCYKVKLVSPSTSRYNSFGLDAPMSESGETLWYGVDGARPLVKMESGAAKGELASLRTAEQIGTTSYRDPQAGYSFMVPAGWIPHPRAAFNGPGTSVDLLDPESHAWVIISGKQKKTKPDQIALELQQGADQRLRDRPLAVSKGPVSHLRLGGHAALTWKGEREDNGMVQYVTWVQSESTRASIALWVVEADFDAVRKRFQTILDSFRMP